MEPIVYELTQKYQSCLTLVRANFHTSGPWQTKISPLGSPEFALVDASGKILYRWSGFTEAAVFEDVLKPICG